ncbi:prepilin-type N-terminal cleavage/methylation domain-containing protein [Rhodoferax sp.]|uniref:prepilin-type N-terminal cleavage/methylation domain-containing protein n=1 Tax=Rhodoferax sp. TaxID=50421 RepID=UPI002847D169|nr:prepilin-type N-terminal cleavage/methylation domain-containing protein [Rhodoferax sp.]MDR3370372.1 prepilin-type N-terminal cleavage/methylation domain-containing protein [Rhodoferax sp.]
MMGVNFPTRRCQHGFTLIELVIVIVLIGVIGGMVAVFMKSPIDAYFASARRAGLTDVADTVVRRMERDIRKALPNSIRNAGSQCVEFIPTKTGARYRADVGGGGDMLDFTLAAGDISFNMLGRNADLPADQQIATGDLVAIYNLGISGADAYAADNTSVVTAANAESGAPAESVISINAKQFPLESPNKRFLVIPAGEQVVRYVCVGASGTNAQGYGNGTLYRQVLTLPLAASSCPSSVTGAAIMANGVSSCNFDYSGSDLQRNALISMRLQLTDSGETVSLQHEVHVSNVP